MKSHSLKILIVILNFNNLYATIQDRIEYKLERVRSQVFELSEEVNEINNIINGEPSVPFTNWDDNLYPVELSSSNTQVRLSHITGLSRFPRSQAALRIPNIEQYGGIWWRNVVAESWIAVSPISQGNFIVGVAQDRSNMEDALGSIALFSIDGGQTFDQSHIPLSRCSDSSLGHSLADFQCAAQTVRSV